MFGVLKIYILFSFHYFFIECLIPTLIVRRPDRNLIAKKRQNTVDMCRMFNNNMMNSANPNKNNSKLNNKRFKRNVVQMNVNPALKEEDAERVEKIVEKLYDDMEAKGERVTYRQLKTNSAAPEVEKKNIPARRFPFAPAKILGPTSLKPGLDNQPELLERPSLSLVRFKHGIIPYYIDSKTYDSQLANIIISAFDYFEKATCIRLEKLRERPTDNPSMRDINWIYISNPSGIRQCVHSNERHNTDGVQMVVFGYDCMSLGDIVHEVMHVLGFSHEHTRSDRDQYVTVLWDNIKPGYKKYFEIPNEGNIHNVESLPYDYASVLHYPARAFSKNGQVTILTKRGIKIGQRDGLSQTDVEKVGLIYANECVDRNRKYLLSTCPTVVQANNKTKVKPTQQVIEDYFKDRLWPFGVVNYKIRDKMQFTIEERENIKAVIRHIESETCIEFRDVAEDFNVDDMRFRNMSYPPKKNIKENISSAKKLSENEIAKSDDEKKNSDNDITSLRLNKMEITELDKADLQKTPSELHLSSNRRHASSLLILSRSDKEGCPCPTPGKVDGDKVLELSTDCFNSVNDLLHVFVHVLGLDHQHNMHDRDQFLHIVWSKLTPDIKREMEETLPPAASVGFAYDYQSVMHYPWLQIKDGVSNIMYPVWNDGWSMGHWQGLSSTDVQKLNLLYFKECLLKMKLKESNK